LALLAADLLVLPVLVTQLTAAIAALAHGARLACWKSWITLKWPILWILHISYVWIVAYLVLRAIAILDLIPVSLAIHALTVGGIGGLTVGMMTRTARGHTGRVLKAGNLEVGCYVLIQLAAVIRVFMPLILPHWYARLVIASGMLWSAAFILLVAALAPMLLKPRIDGRTA
jgi:uncharacterized protein involved in response to NO